MLMLDDDIEEFEWEDEKKILLMFLMISKLHSSKRNQNQYFVFPTRSQNLFCSPFHEI